MLRKKWVLCLSLLLSVYVSGCSNSNFDTYTGDVLRISVIGDTPDVSEENISFSSAEFSDLEDEDGSLNVQGDALFIMPENLVEASDDKYIDHYNKLDIPVFFIGTTKTHAPFVFDNINYEDAREVYPKSYAAGYLYHSENELGEHWIFSGEDEEELTENEIKNIYSDIFRTINNIK